MLTPVRNQGICGSCWAFATIAVVEAFAAIKTKKRHFYSEQQLVDCSIVYANMGCHGGLAVGGLDYVSRRGVMSRLEYGYTGEQGEKCMYDKSKADFPFSKYGFLSTQTINRLPEVLAKGPVAVSVDAALLKHYQSGIIYKDPEYQVYKCEFSGFGYHLTKPRE